jgi:CelD/BcsL family acetyltransferase involved in cellulose biosynthesis
MVTSLDATSIARDRHCADAPSREVAWLEYEDALGDRFAGEWRALADEAPAPNPFYEEWNLRPALADLAAAENPAILAFREAGRLAGLLPVARARRYYDRPIPHLAGWLHDNAFCGTPLIRRGAEEAFWRAALETLDRRAGSEFFLHLRQLQSDDRVTLALHRVLAETGRAATVVGREQRALLASDLGANAYFEAAMSAKKRKELRRQAKRLGELGALRFERLVGTESLERWTDDFLALEHAGWKGEEGSSLACHPPVARYFRAALQGGASADKLERLALTLDGTPIAMLATFLTAPGAFSFKTAFDERYARFSPGVLLQQENLALLDRREIRWCDSCAAADHPMIERIWRGKREMIALNVALGGPLKRTAFRLMSQLERSAEPWRGTQ